MAMCSNCFGRLGCCCCNSLDMTPPSLECSYCGGDCTCPYWHGRAPDEEALKRRAAIKTLRTLADKLESGEVQVKDCEVTWANPVRYTDKLNNFIIPRQMVESSLTVTYEQLMEYDG